MDLFDRGLSEGAREAKIFNRLRGLYKRSNEKGYVDAKHTWLTEGLHAEFDAFIPIGTKEAKAAKDAAKGVIFKTYSVGVGTSRDAWAYNFNQNALIENMQRTIGFYNAQVLKWLVTPEKSILNVDNFVAYDDTQISWSSGLKGKLKSGQMAEFSEAKLRHALYRPFTKSNLFFDRVMNQRVHVFPSIFPTLEAETENRAICVTSVGSKKSFYCLMTQHLTDIHLTGDSQCFPFYTYDEDGANRQENITDWALEQFRTHYNDDTLSKWASSTIRTPFCTIRIIVKNIKQTSSATYPISPLLKTSGVLRTQGQR